MRAAALRRKYGIDPPDFEALGEACAWACPICRKPFQQGPLADSSRRPCIDHDHRTGMIRGLLCAACNYEIGVRGDNAEWFEHAASHLRKPLAELVIGQRFIPGSPGNPLEDEDDE